MTLIFLTGAATILFILVSIPKFAFNGINLNLGNHNTELHHQTTPKIPNRFSDSPNGENEILNDIMFSPEVLKTDCTTETCRFTVQQISENLNQSVDPCEDFYSFACGNFKKQYPIPKDKSEISQFTILADIVNAQILELLLKSPKPDEPAVFRSLKNFYQSCIGQKLQSTQEGREDVIKVLMELGSNTWPVLDDDNGNTWEDIYYNLYKIGLDPKYLFKYYVDSNYTDSTIKLLSLESAKFILNRENLIKGPASANVKHYFNAMLALNTYLNGDRNTSVSEEVLRQTVEFEIELAKAKIPLAELLNDLSAAFNVFTLDELTVKYLQFPWSRFFKSLSTPNINVDGNLKVILTEPTFVARLIQLLETTPPRVVKTYLLWRAVYDLGEYLNEDIRNIRDKLTRKVVGGEQRKGRMDECLETVNTNFEVALSALYVRSFSDENSRLEAIKLTKMMKHSFKSVLNESHWTDDDKLNAFEKVDAMFEDIAYRKELLNDNKLSEFYQKMKPIEPTDTLLMSSLKLKAFIRDMPFLQFQRPVVKRLWYERSYSYKINAFYDLVDNSIIIPAAILQGVFFNASRQKFSNYGALGYIVAHEITHGFDSTGRQVDKDGNLREWLSNATQKDFEGRLKCITEQYNKYTTVDDVQINGALTAVENVADYGGLKTAYRAYQHFLTMNRNEDEDALHLGLNNKQLFWVSSAQIWCHHAKDEYLKYTAMTNTHPTNQIRVNGVLRNTVEFSNDYNCPLGSYMNPINKCMPW